MKHEEHTSPQITDEEILAAFNRARNAKLIVVRPKFTLKRELLQIILSAVLSVILWLICVCFLAEISDVLFWLISAFILILFLISQMKNFLLIAIFLYQRFAPGAIRSACLFKPSCSEYMHQAIIRYGVFKGVKKGFDRLRRCKPPNGGIDEL